MVKKKAKGVVLLEAFLALLLMAMASYGLAAVNSVQFSQLAASADANQAKNYAELEAQYLKQLGYDAVVDDNRDDDEPSRTPRYPAGKSSSDDKASNARNMTKFLGNTEGAKWKSTATLGETITNIGGDPDNKIQNMVVSVYKASDGTNASPRATVTVPLSTQTGSGLTPVGGIIVWPKDSDPSTSSNIWLECNGQTFDTNRFKKLYKVLGTNKVPNFQGMFLRGAGSQSYTQENGTKVGEASTTYSSGTVGSIQGDATRLMRAWAAECIVTIAHGNHYTEEYMPGWYSEKYNPDNPNAWVHSTNSHIGFPTVQNPMRGGFYSFKPKHYRYRLNGSGGDYAYYNLSEYTSPPDGDEAMSASFAANGMGLSNELVMPVDNEIRPVNIAVKYYIRAK